MKKHNYIACLDFNLHRPKGREKRHMSTPETKVINYNWSLLNEAAMAEKLGTMSTKGWHLIGFQEPNYLKLWQGYGFVFEKGEPEERVYRTDYQPGSKTKIAEYVQLCEDAGWCKVFSRRGFYIFSAPADLAAHADFFSDRTSRIAKLKRIRLRALIIGVIAVPVLFLQIFARYNTCAIKHYANRHDRICDFHILYAAQA